MVLGPNHLVQLLPTQQQRPVPLSELQFQAPYARHPQQVTLLQGPPHPQGPLALQSNRPVEYLNQIVGWHPTTS